MGFLQYKGKLKRFIHFGPITQTEEIEIVKKDNNGNDMKDSNGNMLKEKRKNPDFDYDLGEAVEMFGIKMNSWENVFVMMGISFTVSLVTSMYGNSYWYNVSRHLDQESLGLNIPYSKTLVTGLEVLNPYLWMLSDMIEWNLKMSQLQFWLPNQVASSLLDVPLSLEKISKKKFT
jgi:hypothetical protein